MLRVVSSCSVVFLYSHSATFCCQCFSLWGFVPIIFSSVMGVNCFSHLIFYGANCSSHHVISSVCAGAIQPSHIFHFNQLFYVSELLQTLIRIILCDCVCKGHTAIPQISFESLTSVSYFRLLISIILCDCVCKGPYNHPTDFILISYFMSVSYFDFDKNNSVCELFQTLIRIILVTVCARAIQPSHIFHFNQLYNVSDLFQTLKRIILCDCVCKGHIAIPQISFQSLTSGSFFRLLISIILCGCVARAIKPSHGFHFNQLHQWAI